MELRIYGMTMDRELSDAERELLAGCLPYERYQRLGRSRESKQNQVLCAYGLLRFALEERCGLADLPEIALSGEGKPYFPGRPEICFNLSHTNGAVLCALHSCPVGVDIEKEREPAQALLRYYGIEAREDCWRMWVYREAAAKCRGRGIGALPHWDGSLAQGLECRPLELFRGYYAAAAAPERWEPAYRVVTLEELTARLGCLLGR